jgi:hypothetical protein
MKATSLKQDVPGIWSVDDRVSRTCTKKYFTGWAERPAVKKIAVQELRSTRQVSVAIGMNQRTDKSTIVEPHARFLWPRRPLSCTDKPAPRERHVCGITAVGNKPDTPVIGKLAISEVNFANSSPLRLNVESGAWPAVKH